MSNTVLEMNNVSKKFRKGEIHDSLRDLIPALFKRFIKAPEIRPLEANEFWALRDISFHVNEGESLGIIGPNGAGKSTMLKMLCGIMKPTRGDIKVNGTLSALIEVGAGFHGDLTGRENVYLNGTILGMKREQIKKKFDEIVDFSGLGDFIDTPVKRYSSGMYARLGFAVAAHVDPEILIVDEVLSVGDQAFQNKCIEKMKSVLKNGTALLFVSHNLRAVTDLCQRCILLDHGKIKNDGLSNEVVQNYLNPKKQVEGAIEGKEAYISNVSINGQNGECLLFDTGHKAFLEIEVTGVVRCEKLSVTVIIAGEENEDVFDTSTQRLSDMTFSLGPGEKRRVTFELDLHLAPGTYYIGTHIYRYDIQKMYDSRKPALSIQIRSDYDIRGIANLYPKVIIQ